MKKVEALDFRYLKPRGQFDFNMKSLHHIFLIIFCLVSFSIIAQDELSLASISKGFSAGAHAAYISHENNLIHGAEYGYGFGVRVQYGINHNIAVAVSYQNYFIKPQRVYSSLLDRYQLFEYDVIGEYIFGTSISRLRPNLQAGFNLTATDESYLFEELDGHQNVGTTDEFSGITILAGGGLSYYCNPKLSVNLTLMMHTGQFTKYFQTKSYDEITKQYHVNSAVFNLNGLLGVQYHF